MRSSFLSHSVSYKDNLLNSSCNLRILCSFSCIEVISVLFAELNCLVVVLLTVTQPDPFRSCNSKGQFFISFCKCHWNVGRRGRMDSAPARHVRGSYPGLARVDSEDPLDASDIKHRWWCIHPGFKTHEQGSLKSGTESNSGSTK